MRNVIANETRNEHVLTLGHGTEDVERKLSDGMGGMKSGDLNLFYVDVSLPRRLGLGSGEIFRAAG